MSLKAKLITTAIKWTPASLILWVGNVALKGIARLTHFNLDLDARKLFIQTTLAGEAEPIQIWLEDFAIIQTGESYSAILPAARSNKIWLGNILARVTGKKWPIPDVPQLKSHLGTLAEVLKPKS